MSLGKISFDFLTSPIAQFQTTNGRHRGLQSRSIAYRSLHIVQRLCKTSTRAKSKHSTAIKRKCKKANKRNIVIQSKRACWSSPKQGNGKAPWPSNTPNVSGQAGFALLTVPGRCDEAGLSADVIHYSRQAISGRNG